MCKSFTSGAIHKHDTIDRAPTDLLHPKTVQGKASYYCIAEIFAPQVLILAIELRVSYLWSGTRMEHISKL